MSNTCPNLSLVAPAPFRWLDRESCHLQTKNTKTIHQIMEVGLFRLPGGRQMVSFFAKRSLFSDFVCRRESLASSLQIGLAAYMTSERFPTNDRDVNIPNDSPG